MDSWLSLLSDARPKFHPQHMIMIEIAKWLVPTLCRGPGINAPNKNVTLKSTVRNGVPGLPPRDDRHQGGADHKLPQCPQHHRSGP